jgi:hypothetical protein
MLLGRAGNWIRSCKWYSNGKTFFGKEIVKRVINSSKSNTSCGVGVVPAELKKSGIEKLYELLRQIFENCLNGDEIPNDWKIGNFSPIYKKRKEGRIWYLQRN